MLSQPLKFFLVFLILLIQVNSIALTVISEKGSIVYYNDILIGTVKNNSLSFTATFPGMLKVIKPGYIPFEKEITEDSTVVALLLLPSYLKINVLPENAEIYINDIKYDGGSSYLFKPGQYKITISAHGFTTKTIDLFLNEKEEKILDITLKKTVTLVINSDEQVPNVLFNGNLISIPNTFEVLPGKYHLVLPSNFAQNIQVYDIPQVDYFSIKINTQKLHNLQISGEPENAHVSLNNEIYKLPLNSNTLEGIYNIRIFADGYKEEIRKIDLKSDTVVNYVLEPYNLYKLRISENNYRVEFDGFTLDRFIRKVYFTTIRDSDDNVVWFGFSDGSLEKIPTTIPVLVGSDYQVTIGDKTYSGPAVLQVQQGQRISLYNRLSGTETLTVEKPTIFDSVDKCLVNIYSKTVTDVYVDGKYIGKTPIYLFATNSGKHSLILKKNGQEVFKTEFFVSHGKLNEIRVDKVDK